MILHPLLGPTCLWVSEHCSSSCQRQPLTQTFQVPSPWTQDRLEALCLPYCAHTVRKRSHLWPKWCKATNFLIRKTENNALCLPYWAHTVHKRSHLWPTVHDVNQKHCCHLIIKQFIYLAYHAHTVRKRSHIWPKCCKTTNSIARNQTIKDSSNKTIIFPMGYKVEIFSTLG